jgi:hypothetical protein
MIFANRTINKALILLREESCQNCGYFFYTRVGCYDFHSKECVTKNWCKHWKKEDNKELRKSFKIKM